MRRFLLIWVSLLLTLPAGCADAGGESTSSSDRAADIIARGYEDGVLHGASSVVTPGAAPARRTGGRATEPDGAPISHDTRFRVASLTKIFTQVAFARLAQEERVDLDAPLSRYRPNLNARWADTITIRQLLTFRSGLPRERAGGANPIESGVRYDDDGRALAFLDTLLHDSPETEPGSRVSYSNLGYMHLGGVLEFVTGMNAEDAMREVVFAPAGMSDTGLLGADELDGVRHANGHQRTSEGVYAVVSQLPASVRYTAGGFYSTVADLERLSLALLSGPLLRGEARREFFSGFGERDGLSFRAAGLLPGFANVWNVETEPPSAVIILNNAVPGSPQPVVDLLDSAVAELANAAAEDAESHRRPQMKKEGWTRIASPDEIPAHPVKDAALAYVRTLALNDHDALYPAVLALHGENEAELDDEDRERYFNFSAWELRMYNTYGPFTLAAWRLSPNNRLDLYLEGRERRAVHYGFTPSATKPGRRERQGVRHVRVHPDRRGDAPGTGAALGVSCTVPTRRGAPRDRRNRPSRCRRDRRGRRSCSTRRGVRRGRPIPRRYRRLGRRRSSRASRQTARRRRG